MASQGRLLITGGSGLVGRNLLAHPRARDWEILAPDSSELDLMNAAAVEDWLRANRPSAVVHAAGRVGGVHARQRAPVAFLNENLAIGRNMIMSAYSAGVRHFLNLSSTSIYPAAARNPLKEDDILTGALDPLDEGYAIAKIAATRLCQYIRREDEGALYKTFIPCNLYGVFDKFDPVRSHMIPSAIHKLHMARIEDRPSVEIWGDGTARREFMFAADLADAVFRALDDMESVPDLMNVGLGHDYSINEYYAEAARVIGWHGEFVHDLTKPTGMKQKLCSTERLEAWGWNAPTSLQDGLRKTYEHYLETKA